MQDGNEEPRSRNEVSLSLRELHGRDIINIPS
jgi:hypothetical protein